MDESRKFSYARKTKKEYVDIKDIEHQITYPGQEEFNLRNVSYTPGENNYLNEYNEDDE
ncbi:hypothetical protein NC797_12000 [Aquibacillus sp. 3ASR75-11]|uniref:Uncharacterized protein n=1 Tax=Terrihalobacillus insolitus TaxID=2950438 RepID=A0A9X3WVZ3_9BACI|nr:hypothetical protein [Terrihalobacillus insolitus]MDC3413484.1 hypothetical protein [Terrihalobacillus insolitus]MDC3425226.1 hypothetical protein [Terrihalobacillus insolitus]